MSEPRMLAEPTSALRFNKITVAGKSRFILQQTWRVRVVEEHDVVTHTYNEWRDVETVEDGT